MFYKNCMLLIVMSMFSLFTHAATAPNYVSGAITNITGVPLGFLVEIGASEKPENCANTTSKWMLIKQEHTAMISLLLTAWTIGREVNIYTVPADSSVHYCDVRQVYIRH